MALLYLNTQINKQTEENHQNDSIDFDGNKCCGNGLRQERTDFKNMDLVTSSSPRKRE